MISLTESAATQIAKVISKRGKGLGVRLGVKSSGCNGLSHSLEFVDVIGETDIVTEHNGITVFVDSRSYPYLVDTELDYVKEGLQEGFAFNNPNLVSSCGCGKSFSVKAGTE